MKIIALIRKLLLTWKYVCLVCCLFFIFKKHPKPLRHCGQFQLNSKMWLGWIPNLDLCLIFVYWKEVSCKMSATVYIWLVYLKRTLKTNIYCISWGTVFLKQAPFTNSMSKENKLLGCMWPPSSPLEGLASQLLTAYICTTSVKVITDSRGVCAVGQCHKHGSTLGKKGQ